MKRALDVFQSNMANVANLAALHAALQASTTTALDLTDLLRAQLVLAVSAFDHYMHELARLGMLEIFMGARADCVGFKRLRVSLSGFQAGIASPGSAAWLDQEIREQLGWQSFQKPEKVAEAFQYISDVKLWEQLASRLGRSAQDIRAELQLIVDRRNKIAHEADLDPSFPQKRWPIDATMVGSASSFLENLAAEIFQLL